MDDALFWHALRESFRADPVDHAELLKDALAALPWFQAVDFHARFEELVAAADTPGLRAAAVVVNGDGSDAGFRHFRIGLVARGKDAYEAALRDPDTLSGELDGEPVDGFGLDRAALRAYEANTGKADFFDRLAERHPDPPPASKSGPAPDEATARRWFPNLSALYPPAADAEADA